MADERTSVASFVRLNRDNYYVWTKLARSDLIERKCWEAVVPGFVDADGNPAETLTEVQADKNDRALAYLLKAVEYYYIEDIGECETAREAWTTLEDINSKFDTLHTLMHLKDLTTATKQPEESMTEYIARVTALIRKCAKADITFGDKANALFYLLGLPKEYEDFSRSLRRDEADLTAKGIKAKLLAEERRIGKDATSGSDIWETDAAQAFNTQGGEFYDPDVSQDHPAGRGRTQGRRPWGPRQQRGWFPNPQQQVQRGATRQPWSRPSRRGARSSRSRQRGGTGRGWPYQYGGQQYGGNQAGQGDGGEAPTHHQRPYKCYICGGLGHIAALCPSYNEETKPTARVAVSESESVSRSECSSGAINVKCECARKIQNKDDAVLL